MTYYDTDRDAGSLSSTPDVPVRLPVRGDRLDLAAVTSERLALSQSGRLADQPRQRRRRVAAAAGGLVPLFLRYALAEAADVADAQAEDDISADDKMLIQTTWDADNVPFLFGYRLDKTQAPAAQAIDLAASIIVYPWFGHEVELFKIPIDPDDPCADPGCRQIYALDIETPAVFTAMNCDGRFYLINGAGSILTEAPTIDTVCQIEDPPP